MAEPIHISRKLTDTIEVGVSIFGRFHIKHYCVETNEHLRPIGHKWTDWAEIIMEVGHRSTQTLTLLDIEQDLICYGCGLRGTIERGEWKDVKHPSLSKHWK